MRYFFLFFLITINCFSQKSYSFDYLIEYSFVSYKYSTSNKKIYYLTNSKDNSYFAKIESLDTLSFSLEFIAQDKIWTKTKIEKKYFFEAEFIKGTCDSILTHRNYFKEKTKHYKFEVLSDTIINNLSLERYKLMFIGKRKGKRSNPIGSNLYIIEDSTKFHLPTLTHPTAFGEWKEEGQIPNGIFKEKIFLDFEDNVAEKHILKDYYMTNKTLIIPEDCLEQ